jgi:ubiquinone/menaquinone biosynthesis C-methylase UbiE
LVFLLNSLKPILWINRRNENDIIDLYNSITPFVQLALADANNNMLNFGYWTKAITSPLEAQIELSRMVGDFADLQSAKRVIDLGSGFSAPAMFWKSRYNNNDNFLDIFCLDINLKQLRAALEKINLRTARITRSNLFYDYMVSKPIKSKNTTISLVNASATKLPFADNSVDRIVALESAQHFKPLSRFLIESKRVLRPEGLLVLAIPVLGPHLSNQSFIQQLARLEVLYFTWASEHYSLEKIKSIIRIEGLEIQDILHIGHHVYEPSADYYIQNRGIIKQRLKTKAFSQVESLYTQFVERIVYISALKMKDLSKKDIIDYVLIKATAIAL